LRLLISQEAGDLIYFPVLREDREKEERNLQPSYRNMVVGFPKNSFPGIQNSEGMRRWLLSAAANR